MAGFAVVDMQTTGLFAGYPSSIVEIAVVQTTAEGQIESTWSSLVRPIAPFDAHAHGITPDAVAGAPTFAEVAPTLVEKLEGRALAGHERAFVAAFLTAAFTAIGYAAPISPETTVCTMCMVHKFFPDKAKRSLAACCAEAGIPIPPARTALDEAVAAARLLQHYLAEASATTRPWQRPWSPMLAAAAVTAWPALPHLAGPVPSLPRDASTAERGTTFLAHLVEALPDRPGFGQTTYLARLDRALTDARFGTFEQQRLAIAAGVEGLDLATVHRLHEEYLHDLARIATEECGVLDDAQLCELNGAAGLLGFGPGDVDDALFTAQEARRRRTRLTAVA